MRALKMHAQLAPTAKFQPLKSQRSCQHVFATFFCFIVQWNSTIKQKKVVQKNVVNNPPPSPPFWMGTPNGGPQSATWREAQSWDLLRLGRVW